MRIAVHGRLRFDTDRPKLESVLSLLNKKFESVSYTQSLAEVGGVQALITFLETTSLHQDNLMRLFASEETEPSSNP
jgi:hypothetical protein